MNRIFLLCLLLANPKYASKEEVTLLSLPLYILYSYLIFYLYKAHLLPSSLFVTENRENDYKATCFLFLKCKSYQLQ